MVGIYLVEVLEFQLSYFKSWKMMLWKCYTQYASKSGKLSSGHRTGKGQFSFQHYFTNKGQSSQSFGFSSGHVWMWELDYKGTSESITMNKVSGSDGIPVDLFQILKDDAMKVLHTICQQIWKTQQWPQDWKWTIFTPTSKNVQTTIQLCSVYWLVDMNAEPTDQS